MSTKPTLVEEKIPLAPALAEEERPSIASLPVEYVGMLAIMHSENSVRVPYVSGAIGHTDSHVHMEGKLAGRVEGQVSLTIQGNILFVPRAGLIDTHREIAPYGTPLSFGSKHLLQSISEALMGRPIGGVRYDACISLFDDSVNEWEEVMNATSGSPDLLRLNVPRPSTLTVDTLGR